MTTFNTQEIAEEIATAIREAAGQFRNEDLIQIILDRRLKGMAVVPKRPQMKDGDLFILMETSHKNRAYCIARYAESHKFAKHPDEFIAMTAKEMLFMLDRSLIAEAEKA